MSNGIHHEVNCTTGEEIIRDRTPEEIEVGRAARPTLDEFKERGKRRARSILELRRGALVSLRPGQKTEEEFKRAEGRAWEAELKPDPPIKGDYLMAEAEAVEEEVTIAERLQSYLDNEATLKVALAEIAGLERRAVRGIEGAVDEEAVNGIVEALS